MEFELRSKCAIVTGGSSGIGYTIAKLLLSEGVKVIITGRHLDSLKDKADQLGCKYIQWDVSDISIINSKIKECEQLLGSKIDTLINNAGIYYPESISKILKVTEKQYDEIMNINLKSTFF